MQNQLKNKACLRQPVAADVLVDFRGLNDVLEATADCLSPAVDLFPEHEFELWDVLAHLVAGKGCAARGKRSGALHHGNPDAGRPRGVDRHHLVVRVAEVDLTLLLLAGGHVDIRQ